jgi:succinate dehydrogenase / fumarate reductase membrane anchor subunit
MTAVTSPKAESVTVRRVDVESNRERYAYLFMRMSGVGLLILAVGHMVIQHVLNSSANLTIQFVAAQWNSWGWRAYDIMLLWLAIPHGINGLRNVLQDYIHGPGLNRIITIVLVLFVIATVFWATLGMILFDPTPFQ